VLTRDGCAHRQKRLLQVIEERQWDLFVTTNYRTIYYFTGSLRKPETGAVFVLWSDGSSALITDDGADCLVDTIIPLETYSFHRSIDFLAQDAAAALRKYVEASRNTVQTAALERAVVSGLIEVCLQSWSPQLAIFDAGQELLQLRKKKAEDEIAEIRSALKLNAAAYDAARSAISVGRTELDVFNAMQWMVSNRAGTSVPLVGDFACGTRAIKGGGPPTRREIGAGDLYILDLFPAPHLYFGDTCRTFAVIEPTDAQYRAWQTVVTAVEIVELEIKPGVHASEIYSTVQNLLNESELCKGSFWHHAGHGIGHNAHERPRLIPGSEDLIEVGDVIALEPALYSVEIGGGIRLEDNYVVRENEVENLFTYPRELWF
jgi:Xaa-Pro aminopeptidase